MAEKLFINDPWQPFSWFKMDFIENTGIAFGIPFGGLGQIIMSILILIILAIYAIRELDFNKVSVKIFSALILGGALGNLYDRIFLGAVRDFIGIGPWPLFNIADMAITVGVLMLAFYTYYSSPNES